VDDPHVRLDMLADAAANLPQFRDELVIVEQPELEVGVLLVETSQ
jgi:hypothetical protein